MSEKDISKEIREELANAGEKMIKLGISLLRGRVDDISEIANDSGEDDDLAKIRNAIEMIDSGNEEREKAKEFLAILIGSFEKIALSILRSVLKIP